MPRVERVDVDDHVYDVLNRASVREFEESVLVARFIEREKLGSDRIKYGVDILRHINLYSILNNGAKANIVYNTTDNFMDIRQIENIYKKEIIENGTRN